MSGATQSNFKVDESNVKLDISIGNLDDIITTL